MATGRGLREWGSIPSQGIFLTPGFVFKLSSNMMVIPVRIDGCADQMDKKKPIELLKIQNNYIRKYHSQNLTRDSSGDCKLH